MIAIFLLAAQAAHADELVIVESLAQERRSFTTRQFGRSPIQEGSEGSFFSQGQAFRARAMKTTGNFILWKATGDSMSLALEQGQALTFTPASAGDHWIEMDPELKMPNPLGQRTRIFAKGHLGPGLSGSTSGASADNISRSSMSVDVGLQNYLSPQFSFEVSVRWEREVSEYEDANVITQRLMALAGGSYQWAPWPGMADFTPYATLYVGIGRSESSIEAYEQSGMSTLLPGIRLGGFFPLGLEENMRLTLEGSLESQSTKESFGTQSFQTTNAVNAKVGAGLSVAL